MNQMNRNKVFVGLSPYLKPGATGHFGSYHEGFYNAFRSQGLEVLYLGAKTKQNSEKLDWYTPTIPLTMGQPLPWVGFAFIHRLKAIIKSEPREIHFFIYEGNIVWGLVMFIATSHGDKASATINLMDTKKYLKIMRGKHGKYILKKVLEFIVKKSNSKVNFTAETKNFQDQIQSDLSLLIDTFPSFTALPSGRNSATNNDQNVLVNIRGDIAAQSLVRALAKRSELFEYFIHGLDRKYDNEIQAMTNVHRTPKLENMGDYKNFLETMCRIIVHYPPSDFSHQSSGRLIDGIFLGIPVSVPKDTALATTAVQYGNASLYDFYDFESIVKQLKPALEFSETTSEEKPTWEVFVRKVQKISDYGKENRTQTSIKHVIFCYLMLALYFPIWVCRGFGPNSWKLFCGK